MLCLVYLFDRYVEVKYSIVLHQISINLSHFIVVKTYYFSVQLRGPVRF